MRKTVLFAPDMHKRDVDFTSIKGYTLACDAVQEDIIKVLNKLENPAFVSMGDWYDKGYRSVARQFSDANYDREISRAVNGEAYICLGNHFYLERDSNPEMYIIQPNDKYKPKDKVKSVEPIFRAVDYVIFGKTQISFFHFDKSDKNYFRKRQPGITMHIGVYHDDCVVPSDVRSEAGYYGSTSNSYLNTIYEDIDIAIIGHIHAAIGLKVFVKSSGIGVPLIIPGALSITENKDVVKHESVSCPVLYVTDDSAELKFIEISTHMDLLKFYSKKEEKISEALDVLGNDAVKTELHSPSTVSLNEYLRGKGYKQWEIDVISHLPSGRLDISSIMQEVMDGRKRSGELTQELDE